MSFGYYRSEVLGALLSTMVIWVLTGVLVYLAILRVINNDYEIEAIPMLVTASCGVVFNIIMYFVLHTNSCFGDVKLKHHGHSHEPGAGHGHGHSHSGNDHSENKEHESAGKLFFRNFNTTKIKIERSYYKFGTSRFYKNYKESRDMS